MNIGIIGFGGMGLTHAYAIENLKYFYDPLPFEPKIYGVCCAHRESSERAAKRCGAVKIYADAKEMAADENIDVIDICTPNIYHYSALKAAIEAKKHIYCEKPLCVTADEAAEAAALMKNSGRCGAVVFNTRFLLPVIRAKELIDGGRLGRILSFGARFFHSSAAYPDKKAGWKQDKNVCGGGVLFDLGSHAIDLMRWLCGDFEWVSGVSQIAFPERLGADGAQWQTNADEAFYMTAGLKCGAVGTVAVGKIMHGTNDDHTFEIYGTDGSVKFDLMQPNFLEFYDAKSPVREKGFTRIECCGRYDAPGGVFPGQKAPVGWLRGHVGSMYNFLSAVHEGRQPAPSFDDAAAVQLIMEKAYLSDRTGRREPIV